MSLILNSYLKLLKNQGNLFSRILGSQPVCGITTDTPDQVLRKHRVLDRKRMMKTMLKVDEGTVGENSIEMAPANLGDFPDANTPNLVFNGIAFKNIPVVNVKVSKNNTIFSLTDSQGHTHFIHSCGIEGYKTCKKGTNIAAQSTALTMAAKVREAGVKTVRIRIRGLGPGRMSSLKGLEMGGLHIVSITDNTRVAWEPPRPKKARRI